MSRSSSALALIGDTFQARIGIWKCWFLRRGENRRTRGKASRSREENQQQTQPTYDAGSGNRTQDTLVGGERFHHCAIPASQFFMFCPFSLFLALELTMCLSSVTLGCLEGQSLPKPGQPVFSCVLACSRCHVHNIVYKKTGPGIMASGRFE